jgi:hypothetical protein
MQWIEIPVIDGETTVIKLINLDLFKELKAVTGEESSTSELSGPTGTITVDVYFEILKRERQFKAIPGWILVTVKMINGAEQAEPLEEKMINSVYWKTIQAEGSNTKFIEQDGETNFVAVEPYADITKMLRQFTGGERIPAGMAPEDEV